VGRKASEGESISALLRRFALHREQWVGRLCRSLGVTRSDFAALDALDQYGPLTPSDLGDLLSLKSASITALVDRMELQGWALRDDHPRDRRSVVVSLTDDARRVGQRELEPYLAAVESAAAKLGRAERTVVLAFLEDLTDNMTSAASVVVERSA
jgi:DNA-binding MarR family transcriptional regulator